MEKLKENIVKFIKDRACMAGAKGVVVGMSGGKDSFVVAKLCTLAVGANNVFGVIMPNGKMQDKDIAKQECEILKIKSTTLNIENLNQEMLRLAGVALDGKNLSSVTTINIPPRLRMNLLYAIGGTLGYLVANTSNLSETMVGYCTKWGDNVGDFAPLAGLTKTEVCELGLSLGLPKNLIEKTPDDGISGISDEEKLGFSYAELDAFIRTGKKSASYEKIMHMHSVTEHKRSLPPKFKPVGRPNHFDKCK